MTPEEAKQLQPGDKVLIEAYISSSYNRGCQFGENGNILIDLLKNGEHGEFCYDSHFVRLESIRKKLKPFYEPEPTTYRKFKALDIVFASGAYWIVGVDEFDNGSVVVGMTGTIRRYMHKDLELICAAENREDRKGSA